MLIGLSDALSCVYIDYCELCTIILQCCIVNCKNARTSHVAEKVLLHCSYRCTLYKRHITSLCCKPTTEILFSMLCDGSEKNNKIIDVFIMDKDFTAEVSGLIMDILALQPYHRWGAFPRPSTST